MYVVFTEDHLTCAVTDSAELAVRFAFKLLDLGIVAKVRRMESDVR